MKIKFDIVTHIFGHFPPNSTSFHPFSASFDIEELNCFCRKTSILFKMG